MPKTHALGMAEVQPGIFEASVRAAIPGMSTFRMLAEGRTFRGLPFTREHNADATGRRRHRMR